MKGRQGKTKIIIRNMRLLKILVLQGKFLQTYFWCLWRVFEEKYFPLMWTHHISDLCSLFLH